MSCARECGGEPARTESSKGRGRYKIEEREQGFINMNAAVGVCCASKRSHDPLKKGNGGDWGLLNKVWKGKTGTAKERSLKNTWEQKIKCPCRERERRCKG